MRGLVRTTTASGVLLFAMLSVPAYAQTPEPNDSPGFSPADTVSPTAAPTTDVPTRKASLTVQPGGCGDVNGVSTEFARVRATYPEDFYLTWTGSESKAGPFPGVYDAGFPVKPGTLEVRLTPVVGKSNEGLTKVVTIPDVCGKPGEPPTSAPSPTPKEAPVGRKKVTAKYECGAVTFTNPLKKSVLIHYGTAQTDDVEGSLHLEPGASERIKSTNKAFGWTAWLEGDQTKDDVGHLWLPGKDLSCTQAKAPRAGQKAQNTNPGSRGLANTGI